MVKKISAGLLMYRKTNSDGLQVLLAHPGGPFFKNKDAGFWSIVKGELLQEEDPLQAAEREFLEETGIVPTEPFIPLGLVKQKAGKIVHAWAFEMDYDLSKGFTSNKIYIEWPPRTGRFIQIPEIDRLEYFSLEEASLKINEAQRVFLQRLLDHLSA